MTTAPPNLSLDQQSHQFDGFCGIYALANRHSGRRYVGQSIDAGKRLRKHLRDLRGHCEHSSGRLQAAWDWASESAFELEFLEGCSPALLDAREQHWLKKTGDRAYNELDSAANRGLSKPKRPWPKSKTISPAKQLRAAHLAKYNFITGNAGKDMK